MVNGIEKMLILSNTQSIIRSDDIEVFSYVIIAKTNQTI